MLKTWLSSKGQLIVPKELRHRHGWRAGTELEVEDRGDVVVWRQVAPPFPPTTLEEVRGSAKYDGPPVRIEEFDEAIGENIQ